MCYVDLPPAPDGQEVAADRDLTRSRCGSGSPGRPWLHLAPARCTLRARPSPRSRRCPVLCSSSSVTVAVCDPNEISRMGVSAALAAHGFEVSVSVGSLSAAREALAATPP